MPQPQQTYIIAIGIDKYKWKDINNFRAGACKNDCDDVVGLLTTGFERMVLYKDILKDSKATKKNIVDLIQSFVDDGEKNILDNNLIIYFSGHGATIEEGLGVNVGCWVPHNCEALNKKQALGNAELVDLFRSINTRDCLLISDSCNSGHLFVHEFRDSLLQAAAPQGPDVSRWAMVSSSSDEDSQVTGRNSFFTSKLLTAIKGMIKPTFSVAELNLQIAAFFPNPGSQHPICERLQFQPIQNKGHMVFEQKEEVAMLKSGKVLFERDLHKLNYKKQLGELASFPKDNKKHLVIFSGQPKSALDHLSHKAYSKALMRQSNTDRRIVCPFEFGTANESVLNILNLALPFRSDDLSLAGQLLSNKLKDRNQLIEIQIVDPQLLPPKQKLELVGGLLDFLSSIVIPAPGYLLVFFLVDSSGTDYPFASENRQNVNLINTTKVAPVTRQDYEDFWMIFRNNFVGDDRLLDKWDLLISKRFGTAVEPLIDRADCLPETVILKICEVAGIESTLNILNPYRN